MTRYKKKVKELRKPLAKTWFTEGEDDPPVPQPSPFRRAAGTTGGAGVKMLVGAAIGKTLDDSVEGTLSYG